MCSRSFRLQNAHCHSNSINRQIRQQHRETYKKMERRKKHKAFFYLSSVSTTTTSDIDMELYEGSLLKLHFHCVGHIEAVLPIHCPHIPPAGHILSISLSRSKCSSSDIWSYKRKVSGASDGSCQPTNHRHTSLTAMM